MPETAVPAPRPRVGLVLGAGGVRGCAHAAVIAVLRRIGMPIDLVVGASVGSIFGLGVAANVPIEDIVGPVQTITPFNLFRFYCPGRLRPGNRNPIARLLLKAGAGKDFSDLPIPFAVTATDIAAGQPTVLSQGPVLPAVQASIALPLIARPVCLDDRVYLDGGLLETIPVRVARELGADRVIAVCLGYNFSAPRSLRNRPWTHQIVQRLGHQKGAVTPRLRDQIRFSCRLYAATYAPPPPVQDADVTIWPDFGNVGTNSPFGAQYCFEQGLKAAEAALPQLEALAASVRNAVGQARPATTSSPGSLRR